MLSIQFFLVILNLTFEVVNIIILTTVYKLYNHRSSLIFFLITIFNICLIISINYILYAICIVNKRYINNALKLIWYLFILYAILSIYVIIFGYGINKRGLNLEIEIFETLKYDIKCSLEICHYDVLLLSIRKVIFVSLNVFNIYFSLEIIFLSIILNSLNTNFFIL
ncbi:hypothetical protein LDVICp006 [lymphocystis disease virus-China]|uniref:Uncharacterized protein n=2 Tax=Lymphocystis disease virus 2 TaxID=159183 RepID=A0A6F8X0B8_9VIRU|nr:hypothetical protein LDVICp006 [lymphocystis disease virus-China]AAU10854.1 hypothetical protein [lymphocystis disease virus-China]BCB67414.1 hypothetical protein [Lymphocystis disease virus 2]